MQQFINLLIISIFKEYIFLYPVNQRMVKHVGEGTKIMQKITLLIQYYLTFNSLLKFIES